ncbi:MAG: reactive intermediate/imine deaminase [Chthonomonadaceae bacterium]|uniref:Enamine deaminase RidA n=1 Tax=Candidatus Nitrosymbiomonas proteolyticus TaxID=2608984 RepID=A0A809RRZ3_9BACT|nr:MAG: endoribonuclease L-PSP [Armatimonadetes bacterium OLB18]MBV6490786.1 2-iminobutanoate/2-iminopropanoate deaminase [Fimbriimonadaceae bacterium]BBO22462.1 enamine deaminase RidA [Candidatus Nitrosymbiomonas proteolyticus]
MSDGILPAMNRKVISTDSAPAAIGPYSQAVRAQGEFVFLSGQIPLLPSGELVGGSIEDQTRQVLENLSAVLAKEGLSLRNVVKTTIFLSSMDHFAKVNEVYAGYFPEEPPARATVAVAGLPKAVDVEIEAVAVV